MNRLPDSPHFVAPHSPDPSSSAAAQISAPHVKRLPPRPGVVPPRVRKFLRHGSLKHLAVFEACVRHGSFSKAGQVLHLAQPTVSVQMKQLAEALGVQLFEPHGKSVQPTAAGWALYEALPPLFESLAAMDACLEGFRDGQKREGPPMAALRLASSA